LDPPDSRPLEFTSRLGGEVRRFRDPNPNELCIFGPPEKPDAAAGIDLGAEIPYVVTNLIGG